MGLFKKEKKEKVALNLINQKNQRAAITASLNNHILLINKGGGLFIIDAKVSKGGDIEGFLREFIDNSINCKQGVIFRGDPKFDYIVIYDKED